MARHRYLWVSSNGAPQAYPDLHTRPDAIAGSAVQTGDVVNLTNPKSIVFLAPCFRNSSCRSNRNWRDLHSLGVTTVGGGYDCDDRYAAGAAHLPHGLGPKQMEGAE